MTPDTLVYDIGQNRYLNITGRCTLRCQFCPKQSGSTAIRHYQLALHQQPEAEMLIPLLGDVTAFKEYVFCGYGEPTLNLPTLLTVAAEIKRRGGRVRVNTDGLGNLFHRRNILPQLSQSVDCLSVSLNAHTETLYRRHCQPRLRDSWQAVNDFIRQAPFYINQVYVSAIDGLDGVDIAACRNIVEQSGCRFKLRSLGTLA